MLKAGLSLLAAVVAGCVLVSEAVAQPEPNGRPTRRPGWEYRPSPGNQSPAFAYDTCPGCDYHDSAFIVVRCEVGRSPAMVLQPADRNQQLSRLDGRTVELQLIVDRQRFAFRMPVEIGPTGVIMGTPVPSHHPIFQALADGRTLVLAGPGGSISMPLNGSGDAIRNWAEACNAQVAAPAPAPRPEPPAPPPPSGGITALGPRPSPGGLTALGPPPSPGGMTAPAPAPGEKGAPPGATAAAPVPPAARPTVPAVPEATLRARVAAFMARNFDGVRPNGYRVQFVDLNDDGIAEALVALEYSSGLCGAANCSATVLDLSRPAVSSLFDGFGPDPQLHALDSRSQGWRDLRMGNARTLVRWRNGRYDWDRN